MKWKPVSVGLLFAGTTAVVVAAALLVGGRAGRGSKADVACPELASLQKKAEQLDGSGRVTLRIEVNYPELTPPWRLLMTVRGLTSFVSFDTDDGSQMLPPPAEVTSKIESIFVLTGIDTVEKECQEGTMTIDRFEDVFVTRSAAHLDGRYSFTGS